MIYPPYTYPVTPERDDDLFDHHRDAEREAGQGQSGCFRVQSHVEHRDLGPGGVSLPPAARPGSAS